MKRSTLLRRLLGRPPRIEEFVEDTLAIAAELGFPGVFDPKRFSLLFDNGKSQQLAGHYAEVCRAPRRQKSLTVRYLAAAVRDFG